MPSSHPRDGCVATNSASVRVIGGAFTSTVIGAVILEQSIDNLNAALFGELRPARHVVADVAAEVIRRNRHRLERLARESVAKVGTCEHSIDLVVQTPDDGCGEIGGTHDPIPLHAIENREAELLERRHVGHERMAFVSRYRERLYFAG